MLYVRLISMNIKHFIVSILFLISAVFPISTHASLGEDIISFFSLIDTRITYFLDSVLTFSSRNFLTANTSDTASTAPMVADGFFKRSDALFSPRLGRTIPSNLLELMNSFSGNRIVWTYAWTKVLPQTRTTHVPVQCTFEYWIPASEPNAKAMECLGAVGKTLGVLPDVRTQAWKDYQLAIVKKQIDAGCTSFQQDGMGASEGMAYSCGTKNDIVAYNTWLHKATQDYARSKDPDARITFSTNISSNQIEKNDYSWIMPSFDFLMYETYGDRTNVLPKLRTDARVTRFYAPIVSATTIAEDDVWLNQRAIATSYALGLLPIIPWDVFTGKTTPRFFGDPADFSGLYGMVRSNQALFDEYTFITDSSGATGFINSLPVPQPSPTPTPQADGTVTSVDTTTYPGTRVVVKWSNQASFKNIPKGTKVRVGSTIYTTIVPTTVGLIYLAPDSAVSVGDSVFVTNPTVALSETNTGAVLGASIDSTQSVIVIATQGVVTKVDTSSYTNRTVIAWTRQGDAAFKSIAKGTIVRINGSPYTTIVDTNVGNIYLASGVSVSVGDSVQLGESTYYLTVNENINTSLKRAVHIVNWGSTAEDARVYLKKNDFPNPPNKVVTPTQPVATNISYEVRGDYYAYPIANLDIWAVLFSE